MTIYELNPEQINELAGNYLSRLADEGAFSEIVGVDYDAPTWDDMARASEIVPFDVLEREYGSTEFTDDDFCFSGPLDGIDFDDPAGRFELPWQYAK